MSQDAVEEGAMPSRDDLLEALADLDDLPVAEHVGRFEVVHDRLRSRLDHGTSDPGGTEGR